MVFLTPAELTRAEFVVFKEFYCVLPLLEDCIDVCFALCCVDLTLPCVFVVLLFTDCFLFPCDPLLPCFCRWPPARPLSRCFCCSLIRSYSCWLDLVSCSNSLLIRSITFMVCAISCLRWRVSLSTRPSERVKEPPACLGGWGCWSNGWGWWC